jgi:hypothetical protein
MTMWLVAALSGAHTRHRGRLNHFSSVANNGGTLISSLDLSVAAARICSCSVVV